MQFRYLIEFEVNHICWLHERSYSGLEANRYVEYLIEQSALGSNIKKLDLDYFYFSRTYRFKPITQDLEEEISLSKKVISLYLNLEDRDMSNFIRSLKTKIEIINCQNLKDLTDFRKSLVLNTQQEVVFFWKAFLKTDSQEHVNITKLYYGVYRESTIEDFLTPFQDWKLVVSLDYVTYADETFLSNREFPLVIPDWCSGVDFGFVYDNKRFNINNFTLMIDRFLKKILYSVPNVDYYYKVFFHNDGNLSVDIYFDYQASKPLYEKLIASFEQENLNFSILDNYIGDLTKVKRENLSCVFSELRNNKSHLLEELALKNNGRGSFCFGYKSKINGIYEVINNPMVYSCINSNNEIDFRVGKPFNSAGFYDRKIHGYATLQSFYCYSIKDKYGCDDKIKIAANASFYFMDFNPLIYYFDWSGFAADDILFVIDEFVEF